ncbi:MAG: hypothetical protein LBC09_05790, partial [Helicobacteraceae bacterium]|nr:hypothetical protein [Helicobacteraceae bacterium]
MNRFIIRNGALALLALLSALVLSGCVTPFSQNNTAVRFENGKPYAIPYGVNYWYPRQDSGNVALLYQTCGDPNTILWIKESVAQQLKEKGNLSANEVKPYFAKGLAGCSAPMSNQELQYRMHQEGLQTQQNIADQQ